MKVEKRQEIDASVVGNYLKASSCTFQGCIPLQGCLVNELTANPDEPGRHLFEIVPGEIPYSLHPYHKNLQVSHCAFISVLTV